MPAPPYTKPGKEPLLFAQPGYEVVLFPVNSDHLSIRQIADYWASEIVRGDSALRDRRETEICDLLVAAWWRGELVGKGPHTRLFLLISLWNHDGSISFQEAKVRWPKTLKRAEDGWRISLPVPNGDTKTWDVESCEETFSVLAEKWRELRGWKDADPLVYPTEPSWGYRMFAWVIEEIELPREKFLTWADAQNFSVPLFWGHFDRSVGNKSTPGPAIATPGPPARKQGRRPKKRERTQRAMLAAIEAGQITLAVLATSKEEDLAGQYGVSRQTVREARAVVLSQFRNVGNTDSKK
jgi:hypothetical protein